MKFNKQGVRDLNALAVTLIEPDTNITHMPHPHFSAKTRCGLNTNQYKMYQPLEPQPITCLTCLGNNGE